MRSKPFDKARSGVATMTLAMALVGCQGSDAETTSTSTSTTAPASTTTTARATTSTSETSATSTTAATPTTGGPVVIGRGQEHRVATSESPSTVECDGGGEVYVIADGSDVIITGDCTEIDLLGSGNTVEIASSLELDVYGNDNQVGAEDVREVDVYGNGNTVTIGAVSEIDVEGSNNVITFATGNPSIDDDGTGNSVTSA